MRREHDVVELAQRMIDRERLDIEYVETCARNLLLAQHRQQRCLIDDRPPRRVDDIGRRLHERELSCPHEAPRALRQDDVDRYEIGLTKEVVLPRMVDAG